MHWRRPGTDCINELIRFGVDGSELAYVHDSRSTTDHHEYPERTSSTKASETHVSKLLNSQRQHLINPHVSKSFREADLCFVFVLDYSRILQYADTLPSRQLSLVVV